MTDETDFANRFRAAVRSCERTVFWRMTRPADDLARLAAACDELGVDEWDGYGVARRGDRARDAGGRAARQARRALRAERHPGPAGRAPGLVRPVGESPGGAARPVPPRAPRGGRAPAAARPGVGVPHHRSAHAGRRRPRGGPRAARGRPHRAAVARRRLPAAVVGRPRRAVHGGPGGRRTAAPRRGAAVGVAAVLRPPARRDRGAVRQRLRVVLQGPRRPGRRVRRRRRGRGRRAAGVAQADGRHALHHDAVRRRRAARPARRAAADGGVRRLGAVAGRRRCRRGGCACTRPCRACARSRCTPTAWPTRSTSGCWTSCRRSAPCCAARSGRPTTRARSSPSWPATPPPPSTTPRSWPTGWPGWWAPEDRRPGPAGPKWPLGPESRGDSGPSGGNQGAAISR